MLQFAKSLTESGWEVEVYEPDKNEERINTGAIRIHGMIGNKRQTVEMNLLDAIPWEAWRDSGNPALEQLGQAEPEHRKEMLDAIQNATELEDWFRKLNPKPRK